jgi:hypothetical protein
MSCVRRSSIGLKLAVYKLAKASIADSTVVVMKNRGNPL